MNRLNRTALAYFLALHACKTVDAVGFVLEFPLAVAFCATRVFIQSLSPKNDLQKKQNKIFQKQKACLTMATEIDDGFLGGEPNSTLSKLFLSCSGDPQGSVHRAWGISLLFVVVYFIAAVVESKYTE